MLAARGGGSHHTVGWRPRGVSCKLEGDRRALSVTSLYIQCVASSPFGLVSRRWCAAMCTDLGAVPLPAKPCIQLPRAVAAARCPCSSSEALRGISNIVVSTLAPRASPHTSSMRCLCDRRVPAAWRPRKPHGRNALRAPRRRRAPETATSAPTEPESDIASPTARRPGGVGAQSARET